MRIAALKRGKNRKIRFTYNKQKILNGLFKHRRGTDNACPHFIPLVLITPDDQTMRLTSLLKA